jgi:hypothetical protein
MQRYNTEDHGIHSYHRENLKAKLSFILDYQNSSAMVNSVRETSLRA